MNDMQTRRNFMQSAVAAGIAVPTVVGSRRHALANESLSPNDKLNIGCIGVGGRGAANVNGVASEKIVEL